MSVKSLLAVAAVLTTPAVVAHEVKLSGDRTVDYTGLKSPTGGDCCGDRECAPVESRWLPDNTLEVMIARDTWARVPPSKIIWILPEALREAADVTHACWFGHPLAPNFLCVFPEATGS